MTGVRVKKVMKSLSESLKVLFIISGFSFVIEVIAQYYYLFFEKINRNMLYIQRFFINKTTVILVLIPWGGH